MQLTDFQTDVIVASEERPVLLDFYAEWCGPCRMLAPVLDQLAGEGVVAVVKVDTDRHRELAMSAGVSGIPDLRLYRHGREIDRTTGFRSLPQLRDWIDQALATTIGQRP